MNTNSNILNIAKLIPKVAYDDVNSRVMYSVNRDASGYSSYAEITLPGVGVYKQNNKQSEFVLNRVDLVSGGFRDGLNGNAYFPITDAQGNICGYATKQGLQSAYDYYPYGTVVELAPYIADDKKRWQSKEFDGEHGKYYFGAHYFDPFFAQWMSPDPANQFANPYTYGGDPINYVDPNGEFTIGAILSATAGVIKEAIKQKEDWWKVNRYDWGSIGNSAAAGAFIDMSGGPAGAAGTMTGFSLVGRVADPDNKDRFGTVWDYFSGGALVDWHGHFVGLNNAQYGGTMDWYRGNVVYSDGVAGALMPNNSGAEFGGHALFVQNRYNKNVIAHEIRHVQQMEKQCFRLGFMISYLSENGWSLTPYVTEYEFNPYENDARYAEFLKDQGYTDIYGNKIGDWTHEEVSTTFQNWMFKKGYTSFGPDGVNHNWQWEERWEHGHDF